MCSGGACLQSLVCCTTPMLRISGAFWPTLLPRRLTRLASFINRGSARSFLMIACCETVVSELETVHVNCISGLSPFCESIQGSLACVQHAANIILLAHSFCVLACYDVSAARWKSLSCTALHDRCTPCEGCSQACVHLIFRPCAICWQLLVHCIAPGSALPSCLKASCIQRCAGFSDTTG